jgi:hypothetical protein
MSNTRKTTTSRPRPAPRADTVTFLGEQYKVAEKIGVWPQMMLARAASEGVMLGDMKGLAAVHATLENVIDPADWGRFQDDMCTKKTDDLAGLLDLVTQAARIVMARGTSSNGSNPAAGKTDAQTRPATINGGTGGSTTADLSVVAQ